MAHSTQLNNETINQQAARHETTADNISQQLDQLKNEVDMTLASSKSAATKALSSTCDSWIESMRKAVLSHLREMAQNMRNEATTQQATDSENMQKITSVPMETGTFLGA